MYADLLYIALLILSAKLAEEVCNRLRQPSILGYILVGILLGPAATSLVIVDEAIGLFIELGVIFLFFLIGFEEIDVPGLMAIFKRKIFYVSLLTFLIPLVFSYQFLVLFYPPLTSFAIASVFSITSLGVLAKVLVDLKILKEPIGLMTFTSGAIVEFVGLFCASIAIKTLSTSSQNIVLETAIQVLTIVVYFAIAAFAGVYIVPRLFNLVKKYGRAKETALGILIGVVLIFVLTAEMSGLHGAIGALLLGITMSPLSKEIHAEVCRGMNSLAYGLFVPIFFAGIGLYFDTSFITMPIAIIIGVLCLNSVGKFLGALVGTTVTKISVAVPISIGLMSKGAVDVALMLTLFTLGIVDKQLFSLYTLSVLVVIVTFPSLLKISIKRAKVPTYEETRGIITPSYLRTAISEVKAKDLMSIFVEPILPDITISRLLTMKGPILEENLLIMDEEARLLGSISKKQIAKVPPGQEEFALVRDYMRTDVAYVEEDEDVSSIIEKMILFDEPNIPVVDKRNKSNVIGVINRDLLNRFLFRMPYDSEGSGF
ncbi:MAG: cation:proton antiporter [Candidatus Methanomethylicia archaeon]|nr:cation:proton antiporter [Candidatus Methanomethylicia archaeon]